MTIDVSSALATALAGDEVPLLRWPAQEPLRRRLAAAGAPRLLLLTADHPPPDDWDDLEDWLREPVDVEELEVRRQTVRTRARRARLRPRFDEGGLLHVGDAWIDLSPGQLPLARLLVDELDRVVRHEELEAACAAAGVSTHATALKAAMGRLERRLAAVGLRLRSIRGRGYLLEPPELPDEEDPADPDADVVALPPTRKEVAAD
jgi:DNA-binding response OmpR family regulator